MKKQMILHGTLTGAASEILRVCQEWGGPLFALPSKELPATDAPRWTFRRGMADGQRFVCDLRLRGDGRIEAHLAADAIFAELAQLIPDTLAAMSYTRAKGPTDKTKLRAECLRRLKEAHPDWSRVQVAMAATQELSESITDNTVRDVYRAMGWKWPKR